MLNSVVYKVTNGLESFKPTVPISRPRASQYKFNSLILFRGKITVDSEHHMGHINRVQLFDVQLEGTFKNHRAIKS
jgi:hypothetical protein